ncbi:hypothetical protein [Bauldia sp.]|uniref:hypothetical protein n=1 Tax=Bauldia sp. TaxID=2575872 RepID=UPI003BA8FA89
MPQTVAKRIKSAFGGLSAGMQRGGTYVLEPPADEAPPSMREQVRMAGVEPPTVTGFAQRLGYSGDEEPRQIFAATMRGRVTGFSVRVNEPAAMRERVGEETRARHRVYWDDGMEVPA